jgi:hypothetical protein
VKIPIDPARGGGLGALVVSPAGMDPEAAADPGQARAAGEEEILVAEGGSPIVGWEVPSVGTLQAGSPVPGGRDLAL